MEITLDKTLNPLDPPTYSANDIIIFSREIAVFDVSRILVQDLPMSNIQQIFDYDINTLRLFLKQYEDSINLQAIIKIADKGANDLEKALFEIRDEFWLTTAIGIQLDTIGAIWIVQRLGRTDNDYRTAIYKQLSYVISGEPDLVMDVLRTLYGATYIDYTPSYPGVLAGYYLWTDANIKIKELEAISAAGVQPYLAEPLLDGNGGEILDAYGRKIFDVYPSML